MTGKTCDEVPVLSPEVQYYSSFTYCVLCVSEEEKNKANHGVKSRPNPFSNVLMSVILTLFAESI